MKSQFPLLRKVNFKWLSFALLIGIATFSFTVAAVKFRHRTAKPQAFEIDGLVVPQQIIDLGTVWSDEVVERTFTLINTASRDARIESAVSDCGCTVVSMQKKLLAPGESVEIKMKYWPTAPRNGQGAAVRRMTVLSVSGQSGQHEIPLYLTGFLAPDRSLRAFPHVLDEGPLLSGTNHSYVIHLKGDLRILQQIPDRIEIQPAQSKLVLIPSGHVNDPQETMAQKDVTVDIIKYAPPKDPGEWESQVRFSPSAAAEGLVVRIRGRSSHNVACSPASLLMTRAAGGAARTATLTFSCATGESIEPQLIKTDLSLEYHWKQVVSSGAKDIQSLQLEAKGERGNEAGEIFVTFRRAGTSIETLTIPVVIINEERSASAVGAVTHLQKL